MARCPKCDRNLRLTDVSQFCPGCGVNMRFYNFEENFVREAKLAELSQAGLKVKLRNLKYSFTGSIYVKLKLAFCALPLLSLLIPSGNITISFPLVESSAHFGILGIVNIITGGSLSYILEMCSSSVAGAEFSALRNALFAYLAVAVFALFTFVFSLLGFISIKNMQKLATITSAGGIVSSVVSFIFISVFSASCENSMILQGSTGFGLSVSILMFSLILYVSAMLWKKGIHPVYDEGVEERVRIYRLVKSGKINIDDLPQPVVETEATRKIDEEIAKEEAAFFEKLTSTEGGRTDE